MQRDVRDRNFEPDDLEGCKIKMVINALELAICVEPGVGAGIPPTP